MLGCLDRLSNTCRPTAHARGTDRLSELFQSPVHMARIESVSSLLFLIKPTPESEIVRKDKKFCITASSNVWLSREVSKNHCNCAIDLEKKNTKYCFSLFLNNVNLSFWLGMCA